MQSSGSFPSRMPGTLSRDNGDIFLQLFPSWLCCSKAEKPRHEVTTCFRRGSEKKSCRSIVFALLRLIFSLQFSLLIANFSSFSKSHSTSALFPPHPAPPRAGASRNCHRWAKEKHTCLFLIYLKSSSLGAAGTGSCQAPLAMWLRNSALRTAPCWGCWCRSSAPCPSQRSDFLAVG